MVATRAEFEKRLEAVETKADGRIKELEKKLMSLGLELEESRKLQREEKGTNEALLKEIERLKKGAHPLENALVEVVEEIVARHRGRGGPGGEAIDFQQSVTLTTVKTKINPKVEHRTLPEVSTLTPKGKVLQLVKDGKLDSAKVISEIANLAPGLSRIEATNVCKELAAEQILIEGKAADRRVTYEKHPDVE